MDATDKQLAEQYRKIANAFVALADAFGPVHRETAKGYRVAAESYREKADELDPPTPPQPKWHDGDLALDAEGKLWERDCGRWFGLGIIGRSTDAELAERHGPLRRVHLAYPAEGDVVVSIKGMDKNLLRSAVKYPNGSTAAFGCIAKAAQAAGLLDEGA